LEALGWVFGDFDHFISKNFFKFFLPESLYFVVKSPIFSPNSLSENI
jgi:hypothetical protein